MKKQRLSKKEYAAILEIAKKNSCLIADRGDLETHSSDDEDFLDMAIWSIKEMLIQAYELGKRQN